MKTEPQLILAEYLGINSDNLFLIDNETNSWSDGKRDFRVEKEWLNPIEFSNLTLEARLGEYFVYSYVSALTN